MNFITTNSLNLYAEENNVDCWFPQTIFEYLSDLASEEGAPYVIHLFREILVYVSSEPDSFPPPMEEGDIVENSWLEAEKYFTAGVHDYGYWILDSETQTYSSILIKDLRPSFGLPVVKTTSFRPYGVQARTDEINREV